MKKVKKMKRNIIITIIIVAVGISSCKTINNKDKDKDKHKHEISTKNSAIPIFKTQTKQDTLSDAFNIAIGDIFTSIRIFKNGLLEEEKPVLTAGLKYETAWTRDASITTQYAGAMLFPEIAKNTMLSVLKKDKKTNKVIIGGEYWDSPLFVIGAWHQYLFSGDREFLNVALDASINHLTKLEEEEFDIDRGLFRGGSFFNDGISGYPKLYSNTGVYEGENWVSGITKWVEIKTNPRAEKGFGLPMMALSTNCIYYKAYTLLDSIASELGEDISYFNAKEKALNLKNSINSLFWNNKTQKYLYLVDPNGNCDYQEAAGISMAILYGVADEEKAKSLFSNTHIEPAGIATIYPTFPRYVNEAKNSCGRHSGAIWPHINGLWALAAAKYSQSDLFDYELNNIAKYAVRDGQFYEVLHPVTGLPYGGLQENNSGKIDEWESEPRQVWCATAYFSMILQGVFGMEFSSKGIEFNPLVTKDFENLRLLNVPYRDAVLNLYIKGKGTKIRTFTVNGIKQKPFVPKNISGIQKIEIELTL